MRLNNWYFALLLLLIPLLHRWWATKARPSSVRFPISVPKAIGRFNPIRALLILKYLGLAFCIFAFARPQSSYRQTERTVSGVDIMLVMDVSASMNIEDLGERSRLDIAKDTIQRFIKMRQDDRIGFLMFSGEPLTLAPPTLDYGVVLKGVRDAETGVLKDGTAIGDGLALAVNRLRSSKAKSRVIVLLTDGDNNVGQIDPMTAGELAAGYGIRVYTIAVGREGRVRLPIRQKGALGNTITTYQWFDNALNPELLQQIAQKTKGKFYRVTDEGTLNSVFEEIDQLEKTEVKSTTRIKYDEAFERPLKFGAVLLVLEQILARTWWRVIP